MNQQNFFNPVKIAFKKPEGKRIAIKLIEYIVNNEKFQNWDECLDSLGVTLGNIEDSNTHIPAHVFLDAELEQKLLARKESSRYSVSCHGSLELVS